MHLKRSLVFVLLALAAVLTLIPVRADATAIYQYAGNPYTSITDDNPPAGSYTMSMSITGSFELPTALAPNSSFSSLSLPYSVNDGRNTLTDANSAILGFSLHTDAVGNIFLWDITIATPFQISVGEERVVISTTTTNPGRTDAAQLISCGSVSGGLCATFSQDNGISTGPGTWSQVPEPGTALLLGASGLLCWECLDENMATYTATHTARHRHLRQAG
jgi:hypothetical protein